MKKLKGVIWTYLTDVKANSEAPNKVKLLTLCVLRFLMEVSLNERKFSEVYKWLLEHTHKHKI